MAIGLLIVTTRLLPELPGHEGLATAGDTTVRVDAIVKDNTKVASKALFLRIIRRPPS